MRNHITCLSAILGLLVASAGVADADVCVSIDQARDTLQPPERTAAIFLVTRQFELAGERVVPAVCAESYSLSHAQLGNTIIVQLSGPAGQREAIAHGMDDLPAVYSQIVKSLVAGLPMTAFSVVDRTNVTASQASARRVHTDSLWYARLGYGSVFGDRAYSTPALGFGYRAELDSFAIDVSFLNFQFRPSDDYYTSAGASAESLLKLSGLYFLSPQSSLSGYLGGGLSYGHRSFGGGHDGALGRYTSGWDGSGLQGELTVGYEVARATSLRLFVQADAVLPFYQVTSETYSTSRFAPPTITTDRRYAPSLIVSIGIGR